MNLNCEKNSHTTCNHKITGYEQTLNELEFEKSIFNACVNGDMDRVKKIVNEKGSSIVNDQDIKNGYTSLHYASRNNHLEICKYLINNGAKTNLTTFSCESTAIHRAAYMGIIKNAIKFEAK